MRNLFIAGLIVLAGLTFSCKKNYKDGVYEEPQSLIIAGPAAVKKGNSVDYATYYIAGQYTWSVTGDAAISSGQGTSKVTIKFGNVNSKVTVTVAGKTTNKDITVQ